MQLHYFPMVKSYINGRRTSNWVAELVIGFPVKQYNNCVHNVLSFPNYCFVHRFVGVHCTCISMKI